MAADFSVAFTEWRALLGPQRVVELGVDAKNYVSSGRIAPANEKEVTASLAIARKYNVSVYPISTGNNWGYGGRMPSKKGSVILDLSRINRILSFDEKLGLVRVEPGVTMGQMQVFLLKEKALFLSPNTGAGPDTSLIGNGLEKGRSGSAHVDRFASLVSLKAILADGSIYESPSSFFKWGVGPYLDGLFVQSNFGIVLEATFLLAPKPARTQGFYIPIKEDVSLGMVVDYVRQGQQLLGSTFPSVSIQSMERVRSRNWPLGGHPKVAEWSVFGILQGEPLVVRAAQKVIEKKFCVITKDIFYFSEKKLDVLNWLGSYLRFIKQIQKLREMEPLLRSIIESAEGKGNGSLLFLQSNNIDFAGLLFVSVMFPMIGENVSEFISEAKQVCDRYGLQFSPTLLNFTSVALYFSILIIFKPEVSGEKEKAHDCYRELAALAEKHRGLVYRGFSGAMDIVVDKEKNFWKLAKKIKLALDPEDSISPGRYMSPLN